MMIFLQILRQFGTFKHIILHLLCFIIFFVGQTLFLVLFTHAQNRKLVPERSMRTNQKISLIKSSSNLIFRIRTLEKYVPYPNGHV